MFGGNVINDARREVCLKVHDEVEQTCEMVCSTYEPPVMDTSSCDSHATGRSATLIGSLFLPLRLVRLFWSRP